jgi:spermidine/putrescine transport system substrate-binding protein
MSERNPDIGTGSTLRGVMRRRFPRRTVLRGAGMGAAGLGLSPLLAACGRGDGPGGDGEMDPSEIFGAEPGPVINFANWPLYLDQAKDKEGNVYYPSLKKFTKATGIKVNYETVIQSNEEFFGKIQPQLAAGDPTGWDIIVITNGRQFNILKANGWVYKLDPTRRPNFDAHATAFAKDPTYDPGNEVSMPWQGGFTGIGWDSSKVGPITKLDDLANPDKVGRNSVGMLTADMPDFVMINLGIDPATSGPEEWKEAAAWLKMQRESGTVRAYYDQGYIEEFLVGNTTVTMAWSGDILYYKIWAGYPQFEFDIPEGGGLLWQDNMMVPVGAENPAGALMLMDWYYKPKIAAMVTAWVLYLSPVEGVRQEIIAMADQAVEDGYKGYANKLYQTAESVYAFPDEEFLARTKFGANIMTDEEAEEWDNIFLPITQQ